MDVTVTVSKGACDHITVVYSAAGRAQITRTYTLTELKRVLNPENLDEAEDQVLAQIKKVVLSNPTSTMAQLKTKIEAEVYKI
jgi:hypothetical protein